MFVSHGQGDADEDLLGLVPEELLTYGNTFHTAC